MIEVPVCMSKGPGLGRKPRRRQLTSTGYHGQGQDSKLHHPLVSRIYISPYPADHITNHSPTLPLAHTENSKHTGAQESRV